MKLFTTKNFKALCALLLVVCFGASLFFISCKQEQKSKIDKKALAQIGFYETYRYNDIAQDISKLCEAAGDSTLIRNTNNSNDLVPVVYSAQESDTAAINDIITKYGKDILPSDLRLMWTKLTTPKGFYELIALKTNAAGEPAMTGESVVNVSTSGEKGHIICLVFNEEGSKQFSQLTIQNISKPIAIVYKDKVLSYPTVNNQIDGKRIEIPGNYTEQEAKDFVNEMYGKK